MTDPRWLVLPLGVLLIVLTSLDVFLTVLHTQAESPVSTRLNLWFWRGLIAVTGRLPPRARDDVLAWGAPLMISGNIFFWVLSYVLGFACLYLPVMHDAAYFKPEPGGLHTPLTDALYFSAATFFTIGYGDIGPVHPLTRLLSATEGGFGLLTISLTVTYLVSVFPLINRKLALAASLNNETGGRADGVIVAERYVAAGRVDPLGERLRMLNEDLLNLG
jgi:hypothetical protein